MSSVSVFSSASTVAGAMPLGSPKDNTQKTPLERFNVTRLIFQYLGDAKSQVSMASVSRLFRELLTNQHVLKTEFPELLSRALRHVESCSNTFRDNTYISATFSFRDGSENTIGIGEATRVIGLWHRLLAGKSGSAPLRPLAIMPANDPKENFEELIKKFRADLLDSIRKAVPDMENSRGRYFLQELAKASKASDDFKAAYGAVSAMQNNYLKALAYVKLAETTRATIDSEAACPAIAGMPDGDGRVKWLIKLADETRQVADRDAALAITNGTVRSYAEFYAQRDLVDALISIGDLDGARAAIAAAKGMYHSSIDYVRWLIKISKVTGALDDFTKACAAITEMPNYPSKARSQLEVVDALISVGDLEGVRATIAEMAATSPKGCAAYDMVLAYIRLAKVTGALDDFTKACAAMPVNGNAFYIGKIQTELVDALISIVDNEAACFVWRPKVTGASDDFEQARAAIAAIPPMGVFYSPFERVLACIGLAKVTGAPDDFEKTRAAIAEMAAMSPEGYRDYKMVLAYIRFAQVTGAPDDFKKACAAIAEMPVITQMPADKHYFKATAQLALWKAFSPSE